MSDSRFRRFLSSCMMSMSLFLALVDSFSRSSASRISSSSLMTLSYLSSSLLSHFSATLFRGRNEGRFFSGGSTSGFVSSISFLFFRFRRLHIRFRFGAACPASLSSSLCHLFFQSLAIFWARPLSTSATASLLCERPSFLPLRQSTVLLGVMASIVKV